MILTLFFYYLQTSQTAECNSSLSLIVYILVEKIKNQDTPFVGIPVALPNVAFVSFHQIKQHTHMTISEI